MLAVGMEYNMPNADFSVRWHYLWCSLCRRDEIATGPSNIYNTSVFLLFLFTVELLGIP